LRSRRGGQREQWWNGASGRDKNRFKTSLEPVWNQFGTGLESVWNRFVTGLELVWNLLGTGLELVWNRFGTGLEPVWHRFGTGLEPVWNLFGISFAKFLFRLMFRVSALIWSGINLLKLFLEQIKTFWVNLLTHFCKTRFIEGKISLCHSKTV
jgi:hypothetical protein